MTIIDEDMASVRRIPDLSALLVFIKSQIEEVFEVPTRLRDTVPDDMGNNVRQGVRGAR